MSDPLPTNPIAAEINRVVAAGNSAGVQLVETLAIADQPWLGYPVIKQLFGYLLSWIDGYLSKAEQAGATFIVIDTQVSIEQSAMSEAVAGLLAAQKSGDENAIKAAIQVYASAQSALVRFDGSAPPQ